MTAKQDAAADKEIAYLLADFKEKQRFANSEYNRYWRLHESRKALELKLEHVREQETNADIEHNSAQDIADLARTELCESLDCV
jgi:hypothetical protein